MKYILETIRLVVPPVITVMMGVWGYQFLMAGREEPERRVHVERGELVETAIARRDTSGFEIQVDGVTVPYREIQVASEVAGRIEFKSERCRSGAFVEADEELIRVDQADYQLRIDRLEKELEQAGQALQELDVEEANTGRLVDLARRDVELQAKEVETVRNLIAKNAAAENDLDKAKRAQIAAENQLTVVKNRRALIQTRRSGLLTSQELKTIQLNEAKLDFQRTVQRAPVAGVVVAEHVEKDAFVQAGAPLFTIEDTSRIEVRCNLEMDDLQWLWRRDDSAASAAQGWHYKLPKTPVDVEYSYGGNTYRWRGELARFDGAGLDDRTRTAPCRVVIQDPRQVAAVRTGSNSIGPPALVRGMYVKIRIQIKPDMPVLSIPVSGLRPGNVAWVNQNGALRIAKVRVIATRGRSALIDGAQGTVSAGDEIIVTPLAEPRDGLTLRNGERANSPAATLPEDSEQKSIADDANDDDGNDDGTADGTADGESRP
jgi:hypothetical protein